MIVWRYSYSTDGQKLIVEKGERKSVSLCDPIVIVRRYPPKYNPITVSFMAYYLEGEIKNNALWLKERDDQKAMDAFTEYYKKEIEKLDKKKDGYLRRIKFIEKKGAELRNDGSCEQA